MLEFFQYFQQEVGLNHVHCWKSVNISGIPKSIGRLPLPNMKYNCQNLLNFLLGASLFLRQMYWLFINFLISLKKAELSAISAGVEASCNQLRLTNLKVPSELMFLQGMQANCKNTTGNRSIIQN